MRLYAKIFLLLCFLSLVFTFPSQAQKQQPKTGIITFSKEKQDISIVTGGTAVPIVIDAGEFPGIVRVAKLFQDDIFQVTSLKPELVVGELPKSESIIIAGTIGKSKLIDQLVASGKLNISDLEGKWETSLIQVIKNPFPRIKQALVIAGSDKRGTIFGLFDLSRQIGVSPWHFWSDVPAKKHSELYARSGRYISGEPKVKYRGIFLNDEEPALGRWAVKNYGGFNHQFYEKVFELILRLKGNYLWPAMWWASFNTDDPINPELAEEMGIVMSTTHHEPMMRAHAEWKIKKGAAWNYETNKDTLQQFWKEGIERMDKHESIVSMGMRGDGDMAMTAETNIALLEKIVADQREIIENVTGKPASETPQLWALYKEVQDYYDNGMRVPDDVTLLLCDDNWGNVRKLPRPDDKPRAGGYGIYYHFDYVGGPRNYKWLNTSPLPAVWEQMHMAYEHGVDRIWLVNVGDLKPMELPISFFLDYAWNP
ncbi:MAG: glycosyl hydrolase 115 family protein, partial [Bacteroidota bacterium]|nr:glycosyl hydrolase 115 family protein [Bacteroidota bacterium]